MPDRFELTRRDALAAVAAGGLAVGIGIKYTANGVRDTVDPTSENQPSTLGEHELSTLVGIAEIVYPSAVSGVESFVRTYLEGRATRRPDHAARIAETVAVLDELGVDWYDARFLELDADTREALLREVGADTAEGDSTGTTAEQVRYYLVNELLYALYASPTGGELVGIENPQGHPGGLESYQRGPGE